MARRGEVGFTLVEVVITVAILAILASMLVPNVTGVVPKGKENAYNGDRRLLQGVITVYYSAAQAYPTYSGQTGAPSATLNSYIDMDALLARKILVDRPRSANSFNGGTGSYGWYVDDQGRVESIPPFIPGVYP
ncbi:MAG: type II secretion system protein [Chloroflexi bacterium]|nr:type II secretion system protein [Chloroflexota bacterium]